MRNKNISTDFWDEFYECSYNGQYLNAMLSHLPRIRQTEVNLP